MSILIQGIDMPIEYGRCMVIFPNGRVTTEFGSMVIGHAIPVPPHGRLIDADALSQIHWNYAYKDNHNYGFHTTAKAWIDLVPTIIPADPADKEKEV